MEKLVLSGLAKTWIFDFDGTLVVHNGYKTGEDVLLPGVKEFMDEIPKEDFVLILTGREYAAREKTIRFIKENGIRCDEILFEMPLGERVLFNDRKLSGLAMSYAVNLERNCGLECVEVQIDKNL